MTCIGSFGGQVSPSPTETFSQNRAPAAVVDQVQTWAGQALISRSGAAVAVGDVFAAFRDETGAEITQAAFGAAMAEAGFTKAKRGGRVGLSRRGVPAGAATYV